MLSTDGRRSRTPLVGAEPARFPSRNQSHDSEGRHVRWATVRWAGVILAISGLILSMAPARIGTVGYSGPGPQITIGVRCGPAILEANDSEGPSRDLCRPAARRR